jgi:ribosomal-protein-alanine N-acetyltransferase
MPKADRERKAAVDLRGALEVGERVFLREPTRNDRQELVARNRVSYRLHRRWVAPPRDGTAFAAWMARLKQPSVKGLLVCRLEDGAIVGVFMLNQIVRRLFQSAYLGYYAEHPFEGQGYMTEGLQLVLRHVFTSMKLHRVEANIQPENAASIALVKHAGFRLEGFSRRYLKIGGRWRDHQRWAILIDDWRLLRRQRRALFRDRRRPAPRASSSPGRRRSS